MAKESEIKERDLYTIIDGKQTDAPLHDQDDKEWRDKINAMYNTNKKA